MLHVTDDTDPVPIETLIHIGDRIRWAPPRAGKTVVVAIDGPAGSGKTSLADRLAAEFDYTVVHMDDFYPGWDGLEAAVDMLTDSLLLPLARGENARYQRWDWSRDVPAAWQDVPEASVLIVEGCGSGARRAAPYLSLLIWTDAPADDRKARAIERDGDTFAANWDRWARQEDVLFARDRTRERADVLIDT